MPSRKRKKPRVAESSDPIDRFAAAIRETEERERARQDRQRRERAAAEADARAAAEHAAALDEARRELERAIEGVRSAKRRGSGVAAADEAWRVAKAKVIELETGTPPEWAPTTAEAEQDGETGESEETGEPDEPVG